MASRSSQHTPAVQWPRNRGLKVPDGLQKTDLKKDLSSYGGGEVSSGQ